MRSGFALKDAGNQRFKDNDYRSAIQQYKKAILETRGLVSGTRGMSIFAEGTGRPILTDDQEEQVRGTDVSGKSGGLRVEEVQRRWRREQRRERERAGEKCLRVTYSLSLSLSILSRLLSLVYSISLSLNGGGHVCVRERAACS